MPRGIYPRKPEHAQAIRDGMVGKKHSPETRAKISASVTRTWVAMGYNVGKPKKPKRDDKK